MNRKIEGIDDEFQELGNALYNLDFSKDADKEKIYEKTLNKINKKEGISMLKNKFKKASVIAASLMVLAIASNPTYAAETAKKLVKDITFGKISFYQNTEAGMTPVRDNLIGQVFDKDGNEVTSYDINAVLYDRTEKLYTKDGMEISHFKDGEIVTVEDTKKDVITIDSIDKIKDYVTLFDYKLPSAVPEGFEFEKAEYHRSDIVSSGEEYKGEDLFLYYEDKVTGNTFCIAETACEYPFTLVGNKNMEQIKVNDNDGVLYETGEVCWVIDDVQYGVMSQGLDKDENIKIAESVK